MTSAKISDFQGQSVLYNGNVPTKSMFEFSLVYYVSCFTVLHYLKA